YLAGEFTNSFVMAKMKLLTHGRWLWTRTIGSTVAGQGVDTLIVLSIAFWGVLPLPALVVMGVSHWSAKIVYEALATPLTYFIANRLKRVEGIDHYDYNTDFNPFRVF
ncbi:MAG: VUT family protein, partial [Dehalococcoidia bacterium]|nr:VUT family protein [Dehalococcoidia bacterium]